MVYEARVDQDLSSGLPEGFEILHPITDPSKTIVKYGSADINEVVKLLGLVVRMKEEGLTRIVLDLTGLSREDALSAAKMLSLPHDFDVRYAGFTEKDLVLTSDQQDFYGRVASTVDDSSVDEALMMLDRPPETPSEHREPSEDELISRILDGV